MFALQLPPLMFISHMTPMMQEAYQSILKTTSERPPDVGSLLFLLWICAVPCSGVLGFA